MDVSSTVWIVTCVVILALFVFDFFAHVRVPHAPSLKESGTWSAVYISIAVVFGLFVWWQWGGTYGGEYFAGYVTEKALSVDNLFVFVIIMSKFAVPKEYQQKVLLLGIVMALLMRGIFIAVGAAAINAYSWVFYLFGAFLIFTAVKLISESDDPVDHEEQREGRLERFVKRYLRTSDEYDGDKLFTKANGKRLATPMLMVLIVIGFTDVLFALDSIPAIYGLTQEPYLVFTANAFALMGLRQLYFLLGGLLDRLVYLSYGLSFILAFIGVKLVLHALHENTLPFINGGEHVSVPEISTPVSLGVIILTLVITTVASLLRSKVVDAAESPDGAGADGKSAGPENAVTGETSDGEESSDAQPPAGRELRDGRARDADS
ncbi:TerC family protein [Gordonia sp. OPL2]|uniref:TerC family protein n=1 Tax=Gordonia sp. OPL2 TaxID=2486274 RepID=UPI001655FB93|nr:TerC family protein [Gordonia sp. OPL2]RPA19551.1 TerC family protein [Gordonia sp. OPL2]